MEVEEVVEEVLRFAGRLKDKLAITVVRERDKAPFGTQFGMSQGVAERLEEGLLMGRSLDDVQTERYPREYIQYLMGEHFKRLFRRV